MTCLKGFAEGFAMSRRLPVVLFAILVPLPAWSQAQPAGQSTWDKLPRMQLERQFAGPLQDTVIQRWRDPADATVCYIYLPITAAHTAPTGAGFVQYGANQIGSISCFAGVAPAQAAPAAAARPAVPSPKSPTRPQPPTAPR